MSNAALGMTMLSLIIVVILLGFPTAFTLMGLGMLFGYAAFYDPAAPWFDNRVFDLMVQRTFGAMNNDTLLSIPLFVLMGYIMERGALVDRMFHSVQLAFRSVPGSLAVTTLVICTFWGIASGLVGAVVVLMGVIAMRPMLNAGYDTRLAAGVITAGGTLGILIPPSVMIIVYAAVAGQSVVKLYAAAMFPGFFLAFLYLVYVIGWATLQPKVAPRLPADAQRAPITPWTAQLAAAHGPRMLPALLAAVLAPGPHGGIATVGRALLAALAPLLLALAILGTTWWYVTVHNAQTGAAAAPAASDGGALAQPAGSGLREPGASGLAEPPGAAGTLREPSGSLREPSGPATGALREPDAAPAGSGLREPSGTGGGLREPDGRSSGLREPAGAPAGSSLREPSADATAGLREPPGSGGLAEPAGAAATPSTPATPPSTSAGLAEPPGAAPAQRPPPGDAPLQRMGDAPVVQTQQSAAPTAFYIGFAVTAAALSLLIAWYYWRFDAEQYEILSMLVSSVMPLAILTFVVLGVILFGITTATESAAVGATGAFLMAFQARTLNFQRIKEAVFLTAKTTAMVCWLFVGSALFSAVFAILGGQALVERWVLAMDLTPLQFLLLSQAIIFILGWPLEWTEIIVIFVPIFLPMLAHFQIDPLLFGTLVFVNLQAAFLSPPVAMSAFYLKGVSPPHVTLNQIFAGMMPYMAIVVVCMVIMYAWPGLTTWLPGYLYGR